MPRFGGLRPPAAMHSHFLPSGEMRNTDASRSNMTGEVSSVMCLRSSIPAPLPAMKRQRVTAAGQLRSGSAIDVKTDGQLRSAIHKVHGAAHARIARNE